MRDPRSSVAYAVLVAGILGLGGCGDSDEEEDSGRPGAACTATTQGAGVCNSGVCATVECENTLTNATWNVSVCTGDSCAATCGAGEECVTDSSGANGYCVPSFVCG